MTIEIILAVFVGVIVGVLLGMFIFDTATERIKVFAWFAMNCAIIFAWVYLAIHFNKWWIALASVIATYSLKTGRWGGEE